MKGRDTLEFTVPEGTFELYPAIEDGGQCFVYSIDGEDVSAISKDAESFTKIMERRPRNYELERMQWEMQANMRRMLEGQASELSKLVERRLAAERALASAPSAPSGAGKESASAVDGKSSDQPSPKAPAGDSGAAGDSDGRPDTK